MNELQNMIDMVSSNEDISKADALLTILGWLEEDAGIPRNWDVILTVK